MKRRLVLQQQESWSCTQLERDVDDGALPGFSAHGFRHDGEPSSPVVLRFPTAAPPHGSVRLGRAGVERVGVCPQPAGDVVQRDLAGGNLADEPVNVELFFNNNVAAIDLIKCESC